MDCFLAACPPLGTFLELEATLADFGREAEVVGPEERPVLLATVYQLLRRAAALRAVDWPECFEAEETSA